MRRHIIRSVFIFSIAGIIASCQNQETIDLQNYLSSGKDIYKAKCQNCHGENGEGLGQLAPPLTDSVFLKNNKARLACIIKNGLNEEISILDKTYKEKMPGFPELTDIEVAQVKVFITNSFGNNQGFSSYHQVAKELGKCK
ncbi:c-type cytochrome [Pedobacter rhizosphaerae]|uniref:Cytochrome C oxidase, cbb3-type, subunit III n=1 Tax=Pedobacter rhizosphaerae TaxID=390241 RepID=A0A1H9RYM8_9SPHI|nr:cytochrome c [Pedobacter rhizosphaerae]SER77892.1 Cytochrome C oxidase, cbb3-type, subunit III [Pedobacter rhizosphaerae]